MPYHMMKGPDGYSVMGGQTHNPNTKKLFSKGVMGKAKKQISILYSKESNKKVPRAGKF